MIKVAICDDFKEVVAQVDEYLMEYQQLRNIQLEIKSFFNAEDLWDHLKENQCDLIILDIELVEMNGVELGKLIREKLNDYTTKIVFISAKDCYDRQLFDVQPLNFLPKPIDKMKLYESIDLAIKLIDDRNHIFFFKDKEGSHRIKIKDILYFESFAHNFMMVTINDSYEFRSNLSEIMNELSDYGFIQVHRSYIINYEHIKLIKYEELVMFNDKSIPISRNKRKEVREMLMRLRGDKL